MHKGKQNDSINERKREISNKYTEYNADFK